MLPKKTSGVSKVLFINSRLITDRGGAENFDIELAKQLNNSDIKVDFMSQRIPGKKVDLSELEFVNKIHIVDLIELRPFYGFRPGGFLLYYLDRFLFQLLCFIRLIFIGKQYQVIQICGWPALCCLADKWLGLKTVLRMQGKPDWMQLWFLGKCRRIIANGDVADYLRGKLLKIVVINPGIDQLFFKQKQMHTNSKFIFIYSGRLVPIKNLGLLIRAFAKLGKRNKLLLVGDGIERSALEQQVKRLKLTRQVDFVGHVDKNKLRDFLGSANAFVICSTYDNFPNAVIEAMASGLPVIGTRVGGIPKQLKDGKGGYLIESKDEEGLFSAMKRLSDDPKKAREMGEYNQRLVKGKFSWQRSAQIWRRFLANSQ